MSIGIAASVAGVSLAQVKGSELDRSHVDAVNQQRQAVNDAKAESAAGIGATDEDQSAQDRDADGRRLWEVTAEGQARPTDAAEEPPARQSKDATGNRGTQLDLTG